MYLLIIHDQFGQKATLLAETNYSPRQIKNLIQTETWLQGQITITDQVRIPHRAQIMFTAGDLYQPQMA